MRSCAAVLFCVLFVGCSGSDSAPVSPVGPSLAPPEETAPLPATQQRDTYDVDRLGVPQFITDNYIDLARITQISRFRSGEGHSYTDDFETCRSMKHYFQTPRDSSAGSVRIYAPVSGEVTVMHQEWAGTQIHIRPADYPAFRVVLFHVNAQGIDVGSRVQAGQPIGTHVGNQTMSDVAVAVDTPIGFKLVSWFDAITDGVLDTYRARGMRGRDDTIISRDARDASPLSCTGEGFANKGKLENWVVLR